MAISFSPATLDDLPQLQEWIQHDPYHFRQGQAEWWLGLGAVLAFCLMDARGPLCYVRLDEEDGYIRIHTQFAPEEVVSKRRLIVGMMGALKTLRQYFEGQKKGMIFNSVSPTLIAFMKKQNFSSVGNDDYRQDFEEK